jgi:colicin import membrane protein
LAEIIDIYRVEIAYQVQRNWAFPDQLAGGRSDLQTLLVFKVMPNGEIKDLFFTDRSGNSHFDESAYRAVMKADPVEPHPKSVSRPYVQMGLRFTPEGIQ